MKRLCYTISALALSAASPALADTSAAELWEEWQAQASLTGQTVNATVTQTDTGLTLTNFTTVFEDGDFTTRGAIDEVQMTENPDGTVTITYSELYSITFTFAIDPGDPPANIELQMRHENLDMRVSGDAGARTYTYTADSLSLTEGSLWGGDGEPPSIDLDLVMTDVDTTYQVTGTDPATMRFSSDGSIGGMTMAVEIAPAPPEEGQFKAALVLGPMQSTSSGTILSLSSFDQFEDGVPEGFEMSGSGTYGSIGLEMMFEEPGEEFQAVYTNQGGSLAAAISRDAISYDVSATGMETRFTGSELPFPVEIAVGSSELSLEFPLAAADTPQDVSMRLAIQDVVAGETLLSMMDPGQAIPRDPSSLLLDVTGQVQVFVDLLNMDPAELESAPGELRSLTVNEMRLAVGGAELTGTADMTFAPGQIEPMPVGSADLQLSGGNALLDALMAGGLVPNEQGAFVRGAANIFARPGATPDTLETTVVFGADGSVTANGIPLQ